MQKKLLAVGNAYVDINLFGAPFTEYGMPLEKDLIATSREVVAGGSALNFARFTTRLGLKTEFVGKLGDDTMGRLLAQLTHDAGIQPKFIKDKRVRTNVGINIVNENGKSCSVVEGTANQSLTTEEIMACITPLLPELNYLYFGGCFKLQNLIPGLLQLSAAAKTQNIKVVVDHGRVPHRITADHIALVRKLVLGSDYYFPSNDEFCELWEVDSIDSGLRKLSRLTSSTIIVKDAEAGAVTMENGRILRVTAFQVQATNTVGAGDSFNAGFVTAAARGLSLRECIVFGCATAALKISQEELPSLTEVEKLISKAEL